MPRLIQRSFQFERSTKNTHRYNELKGLAGAITAVGVLYVQKSALGPTPPQSIDVTIEVLDASDQATS